MKLSKSLEEGICPPTRQGDRVQPATGVLYHRMLEMSTKKWRELLGSDRVGWPGVRGRSAEEAIRQIGGTESFRRVFRGGDVGLVDRILCRFPIRAAKVGGVVEEGWSATEPGGVVRGMRDFWPLGYGPYNFSSSRNITKNSVSVQRKAT
jgi:hypothetical protein